MDLAIEITQTFVAGSAAFLSSIIVFVGSVFLLLALIMGARLAYMVTASVTLAFVVMMGLVWSFGEPLGPVGEQPVWNGVDVSTEASASSFEPASSYPDGWDEPQEGDKAAADLESASVDFVTEQIDEGEIADYDDPALLGVVAESARLLDRGGTLYGMIVLEGLEGTEGEGGPQLFVVMDYNPGNPNGPARMITAGTFLLLVGHLFFLSRMETRALRARDDDNGDRDAA